jgi:hypothetical protein
LFFSEMCVAVQASNYETVYMTPRFKKSGVNLTNLLA